MYKEDESRDAGTVPLVAGATGVWVSDYAAADNVTFQPSEGVYSLLSGYLTFSSTPAEGDTFTVDAGFAGAGGAGFQSGGLQSVLTANGLRTEMALSQTSDENFTVPEGQYLAFRITNNSASDYELRTGKPYCCMVWSYLPYPVGLPPGYPPPLASVNLPEDEAYYTSTGLPVTISGSVFTTPEGSGLAADSTVFYINNGSQYWDGETWRDEITWLSTSHAAVAGSDPVDWIDDATLPVWEDGRVYKIRARASDLTGTSVTGAAVVFTVDDTSPMATIDAISPAVGSLLVLSGTASDASPGQVALVQVAVQNTFDGTCWNSGSRVEGETCLAAAGTTDWAFSMPSLSENTTYMVKARSTDKAGNRSSETYDSFIYQPRLTVTGVIAGDRVYDGTMVASIEAQNAALVGVVTGDNVTLVDDQAAGIFSDKNIGRDKPVTVSGLTLGGQDAASYILTQPTATASITARELTVSGITAADKVYDNNTVAVLNTSGAWLSNIIEGDEVTLDYSAATGAFADAAPGLGKTVYIFGLTLRGTAAGNYSLVQPVVTASITVPEMVVMGNGMEIPSGDTTPSSSDYTDFGKYRVNTGSTTVTFTIANSGTLDLYLTGSPPVAIGGDNSTDFSLTSLSSATVAAGSSTGFQVTFNPSAVGDRTAVINIANSDPDKNPYVFSVQGTGFRSSSGGRSGSSTSTPSPTSTSISTATQEEDLVIAELNDQQPPEAYDTQGHSLKVTGSLITLIGQPSGLAVPWLRELLWSPSLMPPV